ncbi:PREDICTED: transcription elongation factor SPT4-A-like [Nicrophorus vespilloides]|uniref:Transcription elongation factor SPT4 n=1 Tax=Nicrophorus vespilloides TaxID=110193 RepID=A0ABM1N194_NICVS|nr:PREDICTED: transcription elongation factor SPT4-A-like [Nicrophorus vespilloides]
MLRADRVCLLIYISLINILRMETVAKGLRGLRACLVCSLIKTLEQFERDGCENCDLFLRMKDNRDNVYDCTSSNFDGMIAAMSPEESWVCKWQRTNRFCKGVYAISVSGRLPAGIVREMRRKGINYKHRDTSQRL